MKKIVGVLVITFLATSLFGNESAKDKKGLLTFILQTGSSVGVSGYNLKEWGDEGDTNKSETEYLPGFVLNNFQFGIGSELTEKMYLAFMIGAWGNEDFSRYAVTTASLYGKYVFLDNNISPVCTLQGGLFLEDFPEAFLGLVVNPSVGVEFNRSTGRNFHVTLGYLLTYWKNEGTDPGNSEYIDNDEEQRHAVSLNIGMTF